MLRQGNRAKRYRAYRERSERSKAPHPEPKTPAN